MRQRASEKEADANDESRGARELRGDDPRPVADRKISRFTETLRRQFREVVNALTHPSPAPEPEQRKRRTEETRGGFMLAARKIFGRCSRIPADAYAMPALLWNTLDWLNPWHAENVDTAHESDAAYQAVQSQENLYPHL